jgi:hypothetical protein
MGTSMPAFLVFFSCILSGNFQSKGKSGLRNIRYDKGGHRSIVSMAKEVGLEKIFISKVGCKVHIFHFNGGLGSICLSEEWVPL